MTRIKSGKILIVSPVPFPVPVAGKSQFMHVDAQARIFPAINEFQPGAVVFDYEYLGTEFEKILRRFKANHYYSKIKVYCYKQAWQPRADSLLKTIGVDEFIYAEELQPQAAKATGALTAIGNMIENAVAGGKLAEAV